MSRREHGGDSDQAALSFGHSAGDMLDLSTGISPIAYPADNIPASAWNRLPSQTQLDKCLAAARRAYAVPDYLDIMAGSGTQSLLQLIPHLVVPDGPVFIEQPTYNEHRPAWESAGHHTLSGVDVANAQHKCKSYVFVAPNNPTGDDDRVGIKHAAQRCGSAGGFVLIDGAFAMPKAADPNHTSLIDVLGNQPHVVHLRSFGKFFGMAGLRLGFAIGAPKLISQLSQNAGPWAVSSVALEIGAAALGDTVWQRRHGQFLKAQAKRLKHLLLGAGLPLRGGTELFQTIQHDAAHDLHDQLAAAAIWTRKFADWPDFLRFGLPANDAEFWRLEKIINNWR